MVATFTHKIDTHTPVDDRPTDIMAKWANLTCNNQLANWIRSVGNKLSRFRAAESPPAAYEAQVRRSRKLSNRDLGGILQIMVRAPARSLEEFLSEGGDLPARINSITYPLVQATTCVIASLARDEAAARARWRQLKATWVAAPPRPGNLT